MSSQKVNVVVSRGQSQNPKKRELEDAIVDALDKDARLNIYVVPNLYDVGPESETVRVLREVDGEFVVFSWLFERAAMWVLQRNGIRGQHGEVLLQLDDEEEEDKEQDAGQEDKQRVIDEWDLPARRIYCVNLQHSEDVGPFVEEFRRIQGEVAGDAEPPLMDWIKGQPQPEQLQRYMSPATGNGESKSNGHTGVTKRLEENVGRRWYPVIDFSRCTNCMECIDFCLFGVYGVDTVETILVEQPDNCRKGCPACSRVCPENAIIFPQHKTPAIAGAAVESGALKIDLSKLFGAPDDDPLELAAKERDEQLEIAGRDTVGMTVGMPKRQEDLDEQPKDDFDNLLDELDDMDL